MSQQPCERMEQSITRTVHIQTHMHRALSCPPHTEFSYEVCVLDEKLECHYVSTIRTKLCCASSCNPVT